MNIDIFKISSLISLLINVGAIIRWIWKRWNVMGVIMASNQRYRWSLDNTLKILIILGFLSTFFTLYLSFSPPSWQIIHRQPRVYEPFNTVYEKHKTALGNPIGKEKLEDHAYEATHENGTILWLMKLSKYYVLKKNAEWSESLEPYLNINPKYKNDKWLRQRFHPPKGLEPPYFGVAALWDKDEKNWNELGFRKAHCYYFYDKIYYQEFEHGIIIGGFPKNPSIKDHPVLFSLTNDHKWDLQEAETMQTVRCIPPPDKVDSPFPYKLDASSRELGVGTDTIVFGIKM